MFAGCTHRPAVELAERLIELLPPGLTRVFYSDNGSTAVEVALKLAHQYWRNLGQPDRSTFLTLHYAYHGDTVGAMSVSEQSVFTRRVPAAALPGAARRRAVLLSLPARPRARQLPDRLPRQPRNGVAGGRSLGRRRARRTDAAGSRRDDRLAARVSRGRPPAVRPVRHADDCR